TKHRLACRRFSNESAQHWDRTFSRSQSCAVIVDLQHVNRVVYHDLSDLWFESADSDHSAQFSGVNCLPRNRRFATDPRRCQCQTVSRTSSWWFPSRCSSTRQPTARWLGLVAPH